MIDPSALVGHAGWGVWERLVPELMGTDVASQRLLQLHQHRYQLVCHFVEGKRILDIACGVGYGSDLLIRSGAQSVVGVDLSTAAIAYAQAHYSHPDLTFIEADAEQFESADLYDVIVSFETLEHLHDPLEFLIRLRNLLTPGGHLFLSVPLGETRFIDPYHLQAFRRSEIFSLLQQAGWIIECYRQDPFVLTLGQLLEWRRQYPEAQISPQFLLMTRAGLSLIWNLFCRVGRLSIPQLMVVASNS